MTFAETTQTNASIPVMAEEGDERAAEHHFSLLTKPHMADNLVHIL